MPLSLADVLSAQAGGGPVYEGGPDANVTPGGVLAALGLGGPSWLDAAQKQNAADIAAYQRGGVPEMMADTQGTQDLAGGFGGTTKAVGRLPYESWMLPRKTSAPPLEVLVNPSSRDVRGLAGDYPNAMFRYMGDNQGNKYIWDANQGTHYDFFEGLKNSGRSGEPFTGGIGENQQYNLREISDLLKSPQPQGIRAYHGSPYDFEKFDISKIGQGEGAQTYGHGLYFAENPEVAQSYKDQLGGFRFPSLTKEENYATGLIHPALKSAAEKGGPQAAADLLDKYIVNSRRLVEGGAGPGEASTLAALEKLRANKDYFPQYTSKMYEVNINAEPGQFLNWDKPLSEQPAAVGKLRQLVTPNSMLGDLLQQFELKNTTGQSAYRNIPNERAISDAMIVNNPNPQAASAALREAGIPGIRYLDQGSRLNTDTSTRLIPDVQRRIAYANEIGASDVAKQKLADELSGYQKQINSATSNYVVFNPEILDILRKYGLAGLTMGGVLTAAGQEPAPSQ